MKILAADDHWVFRAGLKHLVKQLDRDLEVLEAGGYVELFEIAAQHGDIDLILLDLLMPGRDMFAGLTELRDRAPGVPVVVISAVENRRDVLRAIELGAMGYIPKSASGDEMLKAIRQVLDGDIYMPRVLLQRVQEPSVVETPVEQPAAPETAERVGMLTRRQNDVFGLLGQGKSNADIAQDLGMSEHTVRIHVSAILRTLKVSNRTQAALMAATAFRPGGDLGRGSPGSNEP